VHKFFNYQVLKNNSQVKIKWTGKSLRNASFYLNVGQAPILFERDNKYLELRKSGILRTQRWLPLSKKRADIRDTY